MKHAAMTPTALIVTLQMDPRAATRFTRLRQAHFPPERNWLDAHVTLFHALPLEAADEVLRDCAEVAADTAAFALRVERVHFLGFGVAFALGSEPALLLRQSLARRWAPLLGRQDQGWRGPLHVTVQNKVDPAVARRLQAELESGFEPHDIGAVGLQVWHYVGGPWRPVATFPFTAGPAPLADADGYTGLRCGGTH